MTSTISDTDLLDLSTDLFDEDMQTQDEETSTNKEQCTPKTNKELQVQVNASKTTQEIQTQHGEHQKQEKHQQTLHSLNKKLDSLHTHLERAKQLYASQDRRPAYRPLMQRNLPFNNDPIYEVTNSPASITFRISDRRHLKWNAQEQCIAIRAPHRFDTTSVWHNEYGQRIQTVTHSTDYAKYVYIRGLHIESIQRVHFHFRPVHKYQHIFLEERPFTKNGIKLRLTRAASKKTIIIHKNEYIGNLYLITPLITHVILKNYRKATFLKYYLFFHIRIVNRNTRFIDHRLNRESSSYSTSTP